MSILLQKNVIKSYGNSWWVEADSEIDISSNI